jgi:hypothetical protein
VHLVREEDPPHYGAKAENERAHHRQADDLGACFKVPE